MILSTDKLGKKFNRDWIFRNLSYQFSPGIHAITGPNGSGKSTLLQVLWGQMPASSGSIAYKHEESFIPETEIYRHISIASPYMDLIDEFTLEEMVRFHFQFKSHRHNLSINEILAQLELEHARNKAIGKFSSGMKQRTKLGLAFFSNVPLIFLDEPSTNLDASAFAWYWKQLSSLPKEVTVLIASNQAEEYPPDCKKINILDFK